MRCAAVLVSLVVAASAACAADITALEARWLDAGWPVLQWAEARRLPLDIVVQPQATPGLPPLAMGFDNGRCKLVLSMRGNASAQAMLAAMPAAARSAIVEAVTAHELAHCRRHVDGAWHALPAGLVGPDRSVATGDAGPLASERRGMSDARREEAYADLVALAWTQRRHPEHYADVLAWLRSLRAEALPGSSHDTAAWLDLVADGRTVAAGLDPFDAAAPWWRAGLATDE